MGIKNPTDVNAFAVFNEDLSSQCNDTLATFSTASKFSSASLSLFLNGVRQLKGTDYFEETGLDAFAVVTAPLTGDDFVIDYIKSAI